MKSINDLPPEDQENYLQCPHCHEYIDIHNLANVGKHVRGKCLHHKEEIIFTECHSQRCVEILEGRYYIDLN